MGNELKGGAKGDLADSLALYLEQAFDEVRAQYGLDPLPPEGRDDRMMLFLGIGRGVVNYLGDFAPAFVIESHNSGDSSRHDFDEDGHVNIRTAS